MLTRNIIIHPHTGDSRAVLCRNGTAFALTDDHKAAREDETVGSWIDLTMPFVGLPFFSFHFVTIACWGV